MEEYFYKMYQDKMASMIRVIKGEKQAKVLGYLISEVNYLNNCVEKSQRKIAEVCGVSLKTVNEVINTLEKGGFLKGDTKKYMFSPEVFCQGDEKRIAKLVRKYENFPD